MKKILLYITVLACGLVACNNDDELSPVSVIRDSVGTKTDFDEWIDHNFRIPFNMSFYYHFEDVESSLNADLVPASEHQAKLVAKMVRFLWLDPYTEVTSPDFMREHAPRVIHVVGSASWNDNGTYTLGTAEGGQKVTLYCGNWMTDFIEVLYNNGVDDSDGFTVNVKNVQGIVDQYLGTIHHEFSHIIDQKRNRPKEFDLISKDDYSAQWNTLNSKQAALLGFTRNYGSKAPGEDFAEIYSALLCWDEAKWNAKFAEAEEEGTAKIKKKIEFIKQYTIEKWGYSIDDLRASLARRFEDCNSLDWDNFDIE